MTVLGHSQSRDVLCSNGSGNFEAEFHTGVKVRVGAAKSTSAALAKRVCEATLSWDKQEMVVTANALHLDVDVFGVDLGLGVPVVAFQVKDSDTECCVAYQIYSLQKPPRLLRTLTGGNFFSASDTDLDGRIEIWTADTAAVDGFENVVEGELEFAPTVVLRFEHGRLMDVSSEFQPYFDQQIAKLREELDPQDQRDFKNSDGKLASTPFSSAQRLHQLRAAKIKVLEVVWSYLYSGRDAEAWHSLADMWPPADVGRIRFAIAEAHAHGIRAEVDGSSSGASVGRKKHAVVFATVIRSGKNSPEVIPAQPILMRRPAPLASEQGLRDLS
jgi:hypothetical protein